jgi:hypothetical protein
MGMGVAGMIITSEPVDHSRKFPTFSTSKKSNGYLWDNQNGEIFKWDNQLIWKYIGKRWKHIGKSRN